MELVLRRLNTGMEGQGSMEDYIKEAFRGLDDGTRLDRAIEVLGLGVEVNERVQDFVGETWEVLLKEEWWRARYSSVNDFKLESGVTESVVKLVAEREANKRMKRTFEELAARRWGGSDLGTLLGRELMPRKGSKRLLEMMKTLARVMPDVDHAIESLTAARDRRLEIPGAIKDRALQTRDVEAVIAEARGRVVGRMDVTTGRISVVESMAEVAGVSMALGARAGVARTFEKEVGLGLESERVDGEVGSGVGDVEAGGVGDNKTEEGGGTDVERRGEEVESGEESEGGEDEDEEEMEGRVCRCEDVKGTQDLIARVKGCGDLTSKAGLLKGMSRGEWMRICHGHVRVVASNLELLTGRLKRGGLIERMMSVQGKTKEELWGTDERRGWFRKRGRPGSETDELGPFKYARMEDAEFDFDREAVWLRFGGSGALEEFLRDGNVVVKGLFDWMVQDAELMGMVDAEFGMYLHHLREQNGQPNLGWCRNMWHSLVQQAIRQDAGFYALNVAARPDKRWRLVSYPYYTKFAQSGDSTGFKHIDINIPSLLRSGRGGNVVQTAVSLDDEWSGGCTLIVPGFHKHIGSWWGSVVSRGEESDGQNHSVEQMY